jgi:hypothetical protein
MPEQNWNPSTRTFSGGAGTVETIKGTATKLISTPAATHRRFQLEDEWLKKNKPMGGKLTETERAARSAYVEPLIEKEFPSKPPASAATQVVAVSETKPATSKPAAGLTADEEARVKVLMDGGMTRSEAVRKVRPPAETQAQALR